MDGEAYCTLCLVPKVLVGWGWGVRGGCMGRQAASGLMMPPGPLMRLRDFLALSWPKALCTCLYPPRVRYALLLCLSASLVIKRL